jgi:hypothetical protein
MSSPLRKAFDSAERLIGRPLERVVSLPEASYVLLALQRATITGTRRLEGVRVSAVHALSLPAHRDIRRLTAQVSRLQSSVEEIEHALSERQDTPS